MGGTRRCALRLDLTTRSGKFARSRDQAGLFESILQEVRERAAVDGLTYDRRALKAACKEKAKAIIKAGGEPPKAYTIELAVDEIDPPEAEPTPVETIKGGGRNTDPNSEE